MKKLSMAINWLLPFLISPASALNYPLTGQEEVLSLDHFNSLLLGQEKIMIFGFALLFISMAVNLILLFLYWNLVVLNHEFDERLSLARMALADLAEKIVVLIKTHTPGLNGQSYKYYGFPARQAELPLEIAK